MSNFTGEIINIDNYIYKRRLSATNTSGRTLTNVPVALNLNASNFNFSTMKLDGKDIRFALSANGTGILHSWISFWDYTKEKATIWVKIPLILPYEKKYVYLFFGYEFDVGWPSVLTELGFSFAYKFAGYPLDYKVWGAYSTSLDPITIQASSFYNDGSMLLPAGYGFINTKAAAFSGLDSWAIEYGMNCRGNAPKTTTYVTQVSVSGTSENRYLYDTFGGNNYHINPFSHIQFYIEGNTDIVHNFRLGYELGKSNDTDNGYQQGYEPKSYNNVFVSYEKETDSFHYGMRNRNTFSDYVRTAARASSDNIVAKQLRLFGSVDTQSSIGYPFINWVVVYDYHLSDSLEIDLSTIKVGNEFIPQLNSEGNFGANVISPDNYHYTPQDADPYKLSDGVLDLSGTFIVDGLSTEVTVDIGRSRYNLVSPFYLHFDNDHYGYYSAAKLSDSDSDPYSNSYWHAEVSKTNYYEGAAVQDKTYAAIKLPTPKSVGSLSLRAVSANLNGMVSNFNFYGTDIDPRFLRAGGTFIVSKDITKLCSAKFNKVSGWQTIRFPNPNKFIYYILEIESTYGSDIYVQEWYMSESNPLYKRQIVSQLRLRPYVEEDGLYYFPKVISLFGSDNGASWTTLFNKRQTYTPFERGNYDYWQRFSFTNYDGYYIFKLVCEGNWGGPEDKIKIAEMQIVCREITNATSYQIIPGVSAHLFGMWTDYETTVASGNVYFTTSLAIFADTQHDILLGYKEIPYQNTEDLLIYKKSSFYEDWYLNNINRWYTRPVIASQGDLVSVIRAIAKGDVDLPSKLSGKVFFASDQEDLSASLRAGVFLKNLSAFISTGIQISGDWFEQSLYVYVGPTAWQSKAIPHYGSSTISTTFALAGTLTFWWRVSSESGYDYLTFYINNVAQSGRISGTSGTWAMKTYVLSANSTVKWTYSKDGSVAVGSDCGWVDEINFV